MKQLFALLVVIAFSQISLGQIQIGQDIDGEAVDDYSGRSVSLSADGNTVAIGADGNDGNGSNSGHVRIYEYSGGSWTQLGADIDGEAAGDGSGRVSLSADGSRVAIGAPYNDGNGSNSGHVRIYEYLGGSWTQLGADIDGEAADDRSGYSVSLSADGSRVAIGAPYNDGNGSNSGHVRIYEYLGGSWTQLGADIDGEAAGDQSGYSVSLSADGNTVAIGADENDGNGYSSGHVRIYEYSGGSWTQLGADIDGEAAGDDLGISVSLSADGSKVAIGAPLNDGNGTGAGHVRIYEYSGGSWTQLGADIDGEAALDNSGYSVSLSAGGDTVAIGAPSNDGNGSNSGHVRIYEYLGGSWTQLGSDIYGEAAGDLSGSSVSLSAGGDTVAIGAYRNDGNGNWSGHTRVYDTTPCFTTYSTITRYSCGVFVAPSGQTLNQSGQYKDTITNSAGCDSILTINFYLVEDIYGKTQVCLVTADSATGLFNRIVWEKPTDKSFIDSFFVARETSTNNFQIIGGVHRDSLSVYEDNISIPSATSYKYKITIKDTCGNFRPYGKYHSTIHLQYFGNGIFQWAPYEIEGVTNPIANYNFYRDDLGTGNFQLLISLPGGNTSLTDPDFNLYPNARYRMEVVYNGGVTCSPSQVQMGTSELIQQSVYSKSYSNIVSFGQSSLQEDSFAWKVYPNPTRGKLRISLPIDEGVVKLYNLQGTLLIEQGVDSEEMELNLFGLASGAYIVRLELDHIIAQKMVNILE